jgi:hypothetical protein
MRKLVIAVAGLSLTGALAATAVLADTSSPTKVTVQAKVTPSKAGTKQHPQGVKVSVKVHWETDTSAGNDRPIIQSAVALFPKGSLYNGGKFPRCSANAMNRHGVGVCPKGSIMGKGTGTAFADTVITHPQITIVNGGPKNVCLFTVLNNPARVQACVPGKIKRRSGKWAYELDLTVPRVLQVVAGVPIQLTDTSLTAGRKDWLATTGCPKSGKWPFMVTTSYDTGGSSGFQDSVPCTK